MKQAAFFILLTTISIWTTGCARITSQVVEKPRVDQELAGNRGYLVGSAPSEGTRKQTRQMVQTNVEMPTLKELLPWKLQKGALAPAAPAPSVNAPAAAPIADKPMPMEVLPEDQGASFFEEEEAAPPAVRPAASEVKPSAEAESSVGSTTYTVQKGDTLEKIAAKVYGDSSQWRRIFKANQEKLKSPNRIYAGQKLMIPAWEGKRQGRTSGPSDLK